VPDAIRRTTNTAPITILAYNNDGELMQFTFTIGSRNAQIGVVNGTMRSIRLSTAPEAIGDHIFLPISTIADVFGFSVERISTGYVLR
jgi:hypothetical protein